MSAFRDASLDGLGPVARADPVEVAAASLAARVDRELDRGDGLLFTATPREDLLEVARFARLQDTSWVAMVRQIVALTNSMDPQQRDFAGDEVALALGVSPTSGRVQVWQSGALAALPGLLEAVEVGRIGRGHALMCLRQLDESALTLEQRQAVVLVALARYTDQTPGEWARVIRRLVLTVDSRAFAARKQERTAERRVAFYPLPDEQGGMSLQAPLEQVAAVEARIDAEARRRKGAGDERTMDQLRTDVSLALLTSGRLEGQEPAPWSVTVVTPLSVLEGADTEVAEIPGCPVAVHHHDEPCLLELVRAARATARSLDLTVGSATWSGYRPPARLRRHLEARDRRPVLGSDATPSMRRSCHEEDQQARSPA